eukprot:3002019-Pyramimonas_sp.AAC.1
MVPLAATAHAGGAGGARAGMVAPVGGEARAEGGEAGGSEALALGGHAGRVPAEVAGEREVDPTVLGGA